MCVQAASVENKGIFRLLLERTRVCLGCFWREQGCAEAALGEKKGVVRLLLVGNRVCLGCFG